MKFDANWKVQSTPELIDQLYQMTLLHFKDFRRALYGEGNYRLSGKYKNYLIKRSAWQSLDTTQRHTKFDDFLKNKRLQKNKSNVVVSTYTKFTVPIINTAKKPGQRTRIKSTKTLNKWAKSLKKKMSGEQEE